MSEYYFDGERIKLNKKDFDKMVKIYPNLDLIAELDQLDIELREATNKAWFMTMNAKLNYRNKVAPKKKSFSSSTRDRTLEEDLNDRSWTG